MEDIAAQPRRLRPKLNTYVARAPRNVITLFGGLCGARMLGWLPLAKRSLHEPVDALALKQREAR
jgi:hypothetical protein